MAAARRLFSSTPIWSRELVISEIPETISSKDLPKALHKYVRRQLTLLKARAESQGDLSPPRITAPESPTSSGLYQAQIPNPFVVQRNLFDEYLPHPDSPKRYRYGTEFPARLQKKLLEKYPRHVLPPSQLNPLAVPPRIVWHEDMFKGTEITWTGEWRPLPKGLFANRAKPFKLHKREREHESRKAEIQGRLSTMEQRVEKWRTVSLSCTQTPVRSI